MSNSNTLNLLRKKFKEAGIETVVLHRGGVPIFHEDGHMYTPPEFQRVYRAPRGKGPYAKSRAIEGALAYFVTEIKDYAKRMVDALEGLKINDRKILVTVRGDCVHDPLSKAEVHQGGSTSDPEFSVGETWIIFETFSVSLFRKDTIDGILKEHYQ